VKDICFSVDIKLAAVKGALSLDGLRNPKALERGIFVVRLQGYLIQECEGNAITGHPPTNYPFFNTHAMPQRGVPVPNPTRQNSVFQGWREVNATGAVIDPTGRTPAQVATLRVIGNSILRRYIPYA